MELIVHERGTFIQKHQGRLRVMREKERLAEVPLLILDHVIIESYGVGISSDAVRACAEHGIPIHFLSSTGIAYASLYSAGLTGTVQTRRAQLQAFENERGAWLARAFVCGKLENQHNLLRMMAKYRKRLILLVFSGFSQLSPKCVIILSKLSGLCRSNLSTFGLHC